jgi:hypothetical protein
MVMLGKERGFDVSTKEGLEEWFGAYNAGLSPLPARTTRLVIGESSRRTDAAKRKKRKQQKAARRKNR